MTAERVSDLSLVVSEEHFASKLEIISRFAIPILKGKYEPDNYERSDNDIIAEKADLIDAMHGY